jgi:hypothetical protein
MNEGSAVSYRKPPLNLWRVRLVGWFSLAGYVSAIVGVACFHDHVHHHSAGDRPLVHTHEHRGHHHGVAHEHSAPPSNPSEHDHQSELPSSDDHCVVCQFLANKPLAAPKSIVLVPCTGVGEHVPLARASAVPSAPALISQPRAPPSLV